ncbi:MAG: hypothetical protein Satyrvirus13_10 [Satyrvirus sp.]|uniref:Uncharacterized protein n=1 Tax=Satyrvirus sp. TaxID=2487771 RepID=A0A3G5ADY0_9VIRU|nr:MAG: hypothetical protein Satyrvirus13_10 [Satyrvirus sp.]
MATARGDINEYNIEKILGSTFKNFISLVKGQTHFHPFLFGDVEEKNRVGVSENANAKPDLKDVHYNYTEYIISVSAALKAIENPDYLKATVTTKFSEIMGDVFEHLVKGKAVPGTRVVPVSKFDFQQLPYIHDDNLFKYIVPGYHLLPFLPNTYYDHSATEHNALVNVIRYLYHFIALLDLQNLDASDVVIFLNKNDKLYFGKYVEDIVQVFNKKEFFEQRVPLNDEVVKNAIVEALKTVAYKIIADFRQLSTPRASFNEAIVDGYDGQAANLKQFLKNIGVPETTVGAAGTKIINDTVFAAFGDIKNLLVEGANAGNTGVSAEDRKKYATNSLYNPIYITNNTILEMVPVPGQIGGVLTKKQMKAIRDAVDVFKTTNPAPLQAQINALVDTLVTVPPLAGADLANAKTYAWTHATTIPKGLKVVKVAPPPAIIPVGATMSLDYLYGKSAETDDAGNPIANAPVRYLVTKDQPNAGKQIVANSEFVKKDNVKKINANDDLAIDWIAKVVAKAAGTLIDIYKEGGIANLLAVPNWQLDKNIPRVLVLSLLDSVITDNIDLSVDIPDPAKINRIKEKMKKSLNNYYVLAQRLQQIPKGNEIQDKLLEFKDNFVDYYSKHAGQFITFTPASGLQYGPRRIGPPTKPTLAVKEIKDFYKNVIASSPQNLSFYDEFFNLVELDNPRKEIPLGFALDFIGSDAELEKYRLNVKKVRGKELLTQGQRGGVFPEDPVFFAYINDYPNDGKVLGTWVLRSYRISEIELLNAGKEAVRQIAREVYLSSSPIEVVIYGYKINPREIAKRIARVGLFIIMWETYKQNMLSKLMAEDEFPAVTARWREEESRLTEHMLRSLSDWVRDGPTFYRKDAEGKTIETLIPDECALVKLENEIEGCVDFLTECALSDKKSFPEACKLLFDENRFITNPPLDVLKGKVVKMNPHFAFKVLRQFKFGDKLVEEDTDPFKGFRRFKVESVGEWLAELFSGEDRCNQVSAPALDPCNPEPLEKQLGKDVADKIRAMAQDPKYAPFFNYLDILVEWVNANPQVLNREENKDAMFPGRKYPESSDSFKIYDHLNPYKPAHLRLRAVSCGLERLRGSILNELAGSNMKTTISNIATMPFGIEMPLNRLRYQHAFPVAVNLPMTGGMYGLEDQLKNYEEEFGYLMFKQIYEELLGIMDTFATAKRDGKIGKSIRLKYESKEEIEKQLDKYKQIDKKLREMLINFIKRNELYQASRGQINAYGIPEKNLSAILEKHSNLSTLLTLSEAHNKKAINLIDLLQTIAKAITNKIEEVSYEKVQVKTDIPPLNTVKRPMTTAYPYSPKKI